jgi:hypothetical protein
MKFSFAVFGPPSLGGTVFTQHYRVLVSLEVSITGRSLDIVLCLQKLQSQAMCDHILDFGHCARRMSQNSRQGFRGGFAVFQCDPSSMSTLRSFFPVCDRMHSRVPNRVSATPKAGEQFQCRADRFHESEKGLTPRASEIPVQVDDKPPFPFPLWLGRG